MQPSKHRLIIFTGKGGVGKTTLAMAYTLYLKNNDVNVKYNSFVKTEDEKIYHELNLPIINLDAESSTEIYIARKLNSKTIASWITKTHFFQSLFQMIPSLSSMILMGHLIDELEKDPSLVIVMDSPASGHALTMFESTSNFKKIFKAGLIVNDINRMQSFLNSGNNLKTYVVSLPTELSIAEAQDLKTELEVGLTDISANAEIIVNDSYNRYFELHKIDLSLLPEFLKQKIQLEEKVINNLKTFPHFDLQGIGKVCTKLSELIKDVL